MKPVDGFGNPVTYREIIKDAKGAIFEWCISDGEGTLIANERGDFHNLMAQLLYRQSWTEVFTVRELSPKEIAE